MTNTLKFANKITPVKLLKDRLIYARKMRGLTQAQLAEMVKCAQSTIGQAERGRTDSLREITAIARVLRVPADWLAEGKGATPSAHGAPHPEQPTRIGAGRRSSDRQAWPFTLSREEFEQLMTADNITALDNLINTFAAQSRQRKYGTGA